MGNCDVASNGCIATPAYCKQRLADLVIDAVKAAADAAQAAQHAKAEHGLLDQLQAQSAIAVRDETQLKDELHASLASEPDASDIGAFDASSPFADFSTSCCLRSEVNNFEK